MTTPDNTLACPRCGSGYAPEHRFCGICGTELARTEAAGNNSDAVNRLVGTPYVPERPVGISHSEAATDHVLAGPGEDTFPYYIPPGRVVLLTLLSSGLYIFFWMYITWRHYRDHTGEVAYPIMHALTLLLPFYNFFRLHAHIRVYQELMEQRGVPTTLNPLRTVLIYFGVVLLGLVSFMIPAESDVTASRQAAYALISVGQASLLAWIMWQAQTNLNRFWRHRLGMRVGWVRMSLPELALVVVGFLLGWGMLLIILFEPAWLTAGGVVEPAALPGG